jgi:hypothetical protein
MAVSGKLRFAPSQETLIAGLALVAILLHLALKYAFHFPPFQSNLPLFAALLVSASFIQHLEPKHGTEVHAGKTPEEKVAIVKAETAKARILFVGDGINDAPALLAATVGVAFGSQNDITTEASDAVVLETALEKIDELIYIGRRMRRIAL